MCSSHTRPRALLISTIEASRLAASRVRHPVPPTPDPPLSTPPPPPHLHGSNAPLYSVLFCTDPWRCVAATWSLLVSALGYTCSAMVIIPRWLVVCRKIHQYFCIIHPRSSLYHRRHQTSHAFTFYPPTETSILLHHTSLQLALGRHHRHHMHSHSTSL